MCLLLRPFPQVNALLKLGLNVDEPSHGPKYPGATALHLAAGAGHVDVMDALLENGANIEARTRGCFGCKLRSSCSYDQGCAHCVAMTDFCIPAGGPRSNARLWTTGRMSLPQRGHIALFHATSLLLIRWAICFITAISCPSSHSLLASGTPLHQAAKSNKTEAMRFLIDCGAFISPELSDPRFNPPLHYFRGLLFAQDHATKSSDEASTAADSSSDYSGSMASNNSSASLYSESQVALAQLDGLQAEALQGDGESEDDRLEDA